MTKAPDWRMFDYDTRGDAATPTAVDALREQILGKSIEQVAAKADSLYLLIGGRWLRIDGIWFNTSDAGVGWFFQKAASP